jgi:RNA polymerase sigma-70 factor (ECF subfamily)
MGDATDEELMQRFCAGDQRAFEVLYDRLAPGVQGFLTPMVRDAATAEDLLQATFLSVIRSRDRYAPGSPVSAWVYAIAANAARDVLRKRARGLEDLERTATGQADLAVESVQGDPGLRRQLEVALLELPQAQREAVVLHKVQGLSFEQIAASLGTSATAVRIRAHRGYEKLRKLLAHLEGS